MTLNSLTAWCRFTGERRRSAIRMVLILGTLVVAGAGLGLFAWGVKRAVEGSDWATLLLGLFGLVYVAVILIGTRVG